MAIWVGADAEVEFAGAGKRFNQFDGMAKSFGVRRKLTTALGGIAAQGHNVRYASGGVLIGDLKRLGPCGVHAC